MKRHFLILTILFLSMTTGHGQTNVYHPFPDTNAFWSDKGWNIFSWWLNYDKRYGLIGDTVINGKNYKKIYSLFDSTLINPYSTYFAAIREQNKRIYTKIDTIPEQLLYDFNLSLGDTITYYYSLLFHMPDTFSRVVTKIDSVRLLDGKFRKRWALASAVNIYIFADTVIEGVGSIMWRGLFNPLINNAYTNGDEYSFECFKHNDTVFYLNNPECNRCFCTFLTYIETKDVQDQPLIFPNPFSTQTSLQINNSYKGATLIVYDLYGQQVKQIKNIFGQSIILYRDNLPSGLYILRLKQDNNIISTDKLVIIDN